MSEIHCGDAIFAELEYNALGMATELRRYEQEDNDITLIAKTMYQYNANNQLTSITHKDAADLTLVSHGYTYDAGGNITQYTNSIDGTVTYDYDFLGQLTGADYSALTIPGESYTFNMPNEPK